MKAFTIGQPLWTSFFKGDATEIGRFIGLTTILNHPYVIISFYVGSDGNPYEYFEHSYSSVNVYPIELAFGSEQDALAFSVTLDPKDAEVSA